MKTVFAIVVFGTLLTGCANPNYTREMTRATPTNSRIVSFPEAGVMAQADVGQSMVSTAQKTAVPAIELKTAVEHFGENKGIRFTVVLPAAAYLLAGFDSDRAGSFYEAPQDLVFVVQPSGDQVKVRGGIFIPSDKQKPTEFYWRAGDTGVPMNQQRAGIKYVETTHEQWGKDSFKRELVYSGVSQNTISVLYREFKDDMARPAFSQDLKYDLSQGKVIGYRGARFEVIKADNLQIQYRVLKNLD